MTGYIDALIREFRVQNTIPVKLDGMVNPAAMDVMAKQVATAR
jgi:hypothetical protein